MENERKEWWLFGVMATLIVVIVLLSWLDVPSFDPPTLTKQSGTTSATKATEMLKVSINAATVEELMQVDGIGRAMAERIVNYRAEHGLFLDVEDLLEVEEIGEQRLEAWRPYLTL